MKPTLSIRLSVMGLYHMNHKSWRLEINCYRLCLYYFRYKKNCSNKKGGLLWKKWCVKHSFHYFSYTIFVTLIRAKPSPRCTGPTPIWPVFSLFLALPVYVFLSSSLTFQPLEVYYWIWALRNVLDIIFGQCLPLWSSNVFHCESSRRSATSRKSSIHLLMGVCQSSFFENFLAPSAFSTPCHVYVSSPQQIKSKVIKTSSFLIIQRALSRVGQSTSVLLL